MKQIFITIDGDLECLILGNVESKTTFLITAGKHGNKPEGVVIIEDYLIPYLIF